MANHPFNADTATPSLGASDLANIMGAGLVIGFGGLQGQTQGQTQPKPRRSLISLLRKLAKKA